MKLLKVGKCCCPGNGASAWGFLRRWTRFRARLAKAHPASLGRGVDDGGDADGVVAGVFAHAEVQAHNDRNVFQASPGELPVSDIHSL